MNERESKIIDEIRSLCIEFTAESHNVIRIDDPNLSIIKSDISQYTSEIQIFFWKGDEFLDVIEFFIYSDGKPIATFEEISKYLKEEYERITLNDPKI